MEGPEAGAMEMTYSQIRWVKATNLRVVRITRKGWPNQEGGGGGGGSWELPWLVWDWVSREFDLLILFGSDVDGEGVVGCGVW